MAANLGSDIDRLSGQSLADLNDDLKNKFLDNGGFTPIDSVSSKVFPSVFSAIQNCLLKPLQKHPRYTNIEFVLTGSASEGVNIPNMSRKEDGQVHWELEMDILCVLRDIKVGITKESPVTMVAQEGTSAGYFLLHVNSQDYRQRWGHFCTKPSSPKREEEMYLNPLLVVEDMYKQIEHIFGQIPVLKNQFKLEFNPPAVTLRLGGLDNVYISCDMVIAVELPIPDLPEQFLNVFQKQPDWLADDTLNGLKKDKLHVVGKCSPNGQARVEWRLSYNRLELALIREIQNKMPLAITCYRILKSLRYWHLQVPDFLHSYHLKMIFLNACYKYPVSTWSESEMASNILALLDELLHCLVNQSISSFFLPNCNLIEGVHSDFIATIMRTLSKIRKDPKTYIIDLKR